MFPIPPMPFIGAMLADVLWQVTQAILLDYCLEQAVFSAP